ncbi:hypothetical protein [Actinokineospora diospyrosa]|uniref:PH (Pleckstrin Homology) domain-containing protein n=1 Tax=Actinokineospora diospyrosa TaxID=103728 RepID=A0ABT1IED3_9PSEU|nr:hypothetical protein [Actinokineospora diospyrosa]MCP2270906.1 hypothetical protein [Actinokineospora diospyrosa]
MPPGVGELFIAEVDQDAWRRPLVPWLVGAAALVVAGLGLLLVGWVGVLVAAVGLAVAAVKLGGYAARHKRRSSPLMIDLTGVRLPTGQGPAFLPWDTLRSVGVDGPTLRFRVRLSVTPTTPGVTGLHRRDAWPVASGPGLPLDTRLFTRTSEDIVAALRDYSRGSLRID